MKTKSLTIKEETVKVTNPISGKTTDVVIKRDGTTDEKLAMIMLAPDATREQKNSLVSQWFFERGNENAAFLAELYVSKGTHLKETQAFKRQIRWDFENFADEMIYLLEGLARTISKGLKDGDIIVTLENLGEHIADGAKLIKKNKEAITEARMRDRGFGVYLDKNGQAYSIYDKDIEEVVKKEKEELNNEQTND